MISKSKSNSLRKKKMRNVPHYLISFHYRAREDQSITVLAENRATEYEEQPRNKPV